MNVRFQKMLPCYLLQKFHLLRNKFKMLIKMAKKIKLIKGATAARQATFKYKRPHTNVRNKEEFPYPEDCKGRDAAGGRDAAD